MALQQIVRSLVFPIPDGTLPDPLVYLLKDFRLMVNICIRTAIDGNTTSRGTLTKLVYKDLSKQFDINKKYIGCAVEIACGIMKNYRKCLRKGLSTNKPFVKRLMLKSTNQNYKGAVPSSRSTSHVILDGASPKVSSELPQNHPIHVTSP